MTRLLIALVLPAILFYLFFSIRSEIRKASLKKLDRVMLPDGVQGSVTAIEKWEDGKFFGVLRDDGLFEYYKREQITKKIE